MGAVLIAPHIKPVKGMLGTTFGGNHLACAAAIAVLDVMETENMIANAAAVGEYLLEELHHLAATNPEITEVRGRGLMIGIEIKGSASQLRKNYFSTSTSSQVARANTPYAFFRRSRFHVPTPSDSSNPSRKFLQKGRNNHIQTVILFLNQIFS